MQILFGLFHITSMKTLFKALAALGCLFFCLMAIIIVGALLFMYALSYAVP